MKQVIDEYLKFRRGLGNLLVDHERNLTAFCEFAGARGEAHVVATSAIEFAAQAKSPHRRRRILGRLVRFAVFARAQDSRYEVPCIEALGTARWERPTPFIFTREEVASLVEAAGELRPATTLRPHTFQTLFGLIASTGLRVSEALNLHFGDLQSDGMLIRKTKFRRQRMLPLHDTVRRRLEEYLTHRRKVATADPHVFISLRRRRLCHATTLHAFRQVVGTLEIDDGRSCGVPRLHDLRHTFAVRSLEACTERGEIREHMMALSTYLGHKSINNTYWYLEATPQLMTNIAESAAQFIRSQS